MWFLKWFRHSDKLHIQRSSQWPKIRKKHIEKQPCCMACGSCKKPEVHHIVPVHVDPSKELDPDNLITLCDKYCHGMVSCPRDATTGHSMRKSAVAM